MAQYIQTVTGNASTAANLSRVTAVATAHASNATGDFVSSSVNTDTFTAPNLVNKAVGVGIFLTSNNLSAGAVIRATLQEDAGAGFVDTVCTADVTITAGVNDSSSIYMTFIAGTPYTFTTTTANKYRWKLVKNSGTGTLLRARSSTTGSTTAWAFFFDDRNATIGTSDDLIVANGITSTLTDSMSFGTAGGTSQSDAPTTFSEKALYALNSAIVELDTSASTTVTIKGMIVASKGGTFRIGTESVAYPSSYVAKVIHDMNGTAGNYGIWTSDGNIIFNGGYQPTNYAVNYVSGLGTAASPMITSGDIGAVGDELCIPGTGNYNQTEYKFIKTKNSATSYVLSDTSGGAEAALVNTHSTRAKILNMQRNIIIEPANTSHSNYILHTGSATTSKFYGKNFRTNYIGNSGTGKFGLTLGYASGTSTMVIQELSGYVANRAVYSGVYLQSNRTDYTTYSDNIFVRSASAQPVAQTNGLSNKTLNRWYAVDNNASNFGFGTTNNVTFNDYYSYCANTGNGSNGGHILVSAACSQVTFNDSDFQWARQGGIRNLAVAMSKWRFNDCTFGDVGTNIVDIALGTTGTTMDTTFTNCLFSSATLISGYLSMIEGSEVRFQRYNQSSTAHRWYTNKGKARTETTTKRTGSIALAIEPEDATNGFVWEFHVPANANQQIFLPGYFYRSSITGDVTVDIFLPYSTTSDETLTLSTTSGSWQPFLVSQDYNQSTNELATIRVTVKSAAGTLYLDDFLNSGNTVDVNNNVASFETWFDGKPVDLFSLLDVSAIPAQSAQQVWTYSTTTLTTANTTGKKLVDAEGNAELAAIK